MASSPSQRRAPEAVEAYLARLSPEQRGTLEAVRASLLRLLPDATERLAYGMPAVATPAGTVAGYGAFARHWGYFPMSGRVLDAAGDLVAPYDRSRGGLRLRYDEQLPLRVVRGLVRLRLDELAERSSRG